MFGGVAWWLRRGSPRTRAEFKERFNQKYFPLSVKNMKRTEFQNIRQATDETVMQYMGRYLRLMDYAGGIADTDADQAYHFMNGLVSEFGHMVMTTAPGTLHEAYERSMASETFLSMCTGTVVAAPPPSQSHVRPGDDKMRKRPRQWRSRDRAQSVGSVASPPITTRTATIPSALVRSYDNTPQQSTQSGPQQQYRGARQGMALRARRWSKRRYGRGHSVPSGSGSQRTCWECGQPGHFASSCPRLIRWQHQQS
ncbi:hypothetical protein Scep_009396 [Stephania cephalantha]|uniref:CCHC-type domain-containing protein n=1 Tax=Stephania cephalantha TaxID=152367 RepID=A0AAP0JU48_9MAGN